MAFQESTLSTDLSADSIRRILLVATEPGFLNQLVAMLEAGGYEIAKATSITEAAGVGAKFDAQLAFVDLSLGENIANEILSALKTQSPKLQGVAACERVALDQAMEMLRAGFDDVLAKPVRRFELYAAIERATANLSLIQQRRSVEDALRAGETRFGAVCETSPAPIIITRLSDDTVIFANDACARLFGASKDELIGSSAIDMWHDPKERHAAVGQVRRDGWVRDTEYRMKRADGSVRWVQGSAEIRTIDGEAVLIVGLNDVTALKEVEREALRARSRLDDALESIPDGFALYDADDRLVWCNERYREVYPRHADAIVPGNTFEEMMRDGVARGEFSAAIGREEAWIADRLLTHANPPGPIEQELTDGRWLRVEERRTREGGIVGLRTDITAIKQAEQRAASATARLNDAIESISDGFILYDADERLVLSNRKYVELNPGFQEILVPGARLEDIIRASAASEGAPHEIDDVDSWTRMRLEDYRSGTGSREILHANGRWILASERRMRDGGVVGIRTDITEIKQQQQELAENEARFRAIVEDQTEFIGRSLPYAHTLTFANEAYARYCGKSPDEMVGTDFMEQIPEAERAEVDALLATLGPDNPVVESEHSVIAPNGDVRWHQWTDRAIFDAGGNITEIQAVGRDITDIRQAQEAIRLSEEKFSKAFRAGPDGILITRRSDGTIIDANDRFLSRVRRNREDTVGRLVSDVVKWANANCRDAMMDAIETTGECTDLEADFRFADGKMANYLMAARAIEVDGEPCILTIARDITERKRAEDALRESEERFKAVIDNSPSIFVLQDTESRLLMVNRRFEEIFGVSNDEVQGKAPHDVHPPEYAEALCEMNRKAFEGRCVVERELDAEQEDGSVTSRIVTRFPVFGPNGDVIAVGGISTDITERKQAEERLRQAQKMEAVGQLTGGIAHDFNNLLAIILGNAELLKEGLGDVAALADNVILAANRGGELTHQLLAFSRRQPLMPQITDFDDLIAGMADMFRRTLGETIEIQTRDTPGLWPIEVDPGQSENAILNLVINARDAMANGGLLRIETANISMTNAADKQSAEIPAGDYVMLAVTDTGVGMSADILKRAFEPFFTTKEVGQGSGLGLSMVYGFANQSGGHLTMESEPGGGTTVKVYLPRAQESERRAQWRATGEASPGRGETVLLVEDETGVRTLTAKILNRLGYEVIEAPDGNAAVETLESDANVDLLLTDVVLPGNLSGPRVADEAHRLRSEIKVLFMSGYPDQVLSSHGPLVGGAEVLGKPFGRNHLAKKIRSALDGFGSDSV